MIDTPEARAEALDEERRILSRKAAGASRARRERSCVRPTNLAQEARRNDSGLNTREERRRQVTEEIRLGQVQERASDAASASHSGVRFVTEPPPLRPNEFFDRAWELQRLEKHLANPSVRLITIVGRDGIGKTAMVSRLLDDMRMEPSSFAALPP